MSEDSNHETRSAVRGDSDSPADSDELGFGPYVAAVKRFLTDEDTQPPITMSVEGEWGSGKSTFLNLLADELSQEDHVVVEFNPWRYDDEESLWAAFALELLGEIEDTPGTVRRQLNRIILSLERFNSHTGLTEKIKTGIVGFAIISAAVLVGIWGRSFFSTINTLSADSTFFRLLAGSSGAAVTLVALLNVLGHLKSPFLDTLAGSLRSYTSSPGYKQRLPLIDHFHEDLSRVLDTFLDEDQLVVVLIDDLDRCAAPRAAELMQSINLLIGRDKRLIFVIAMDRKRVAAGIASKYSDVLPILQNRPEDIQTGELESKSDRLWFGYEFIEKFVQVPLQVPQTSPKDIRDFLKNEQYESTSDYDDRFPSDNELDIEDEIIDSELMEKIAAVFDSNPRQAVRFRNLLSLRILQTASDELLAFDDRDREISLQQLAKFVAISLEYPELLIRVRRNPSLLSNLEYYANNDEELKEDSSLRPWVNYDELLELLDYDLKGREHYLSSDDVKNLIRISPEDRSPHIKNIGSPIMYDSKDAQQSIELYQGILPDNHIQIIRESILIRKHVKHSQSARSLKERKSELYEKHGGKSMYLFNLTFSGYFRPDSEFTNFTQQLKKNDEYDDTECKEIVTTIIEKELLCLFVSQSTSVQDLKHQIITMRNKHEQTEIPLEWFDIRARGVKQMEVLRDTLDELNEDWGDFTVTKSINSQEMSVRFMIQSLPDIT